MTRAQTTHTWAAGSVALYKSGNQPLSDLLNSLAPSLVKTNDTGQVNWATVTTVPTGGVTPRDYEVFRFADALQATAPIFVRVDYQMAVNSPQPKFTVGTGTDGAGNITGTASVPAMTTYTNTTSITGTLNAYASSDGSQLMLAHGFNPASGQPDAWGGVVIERFRNADGTANAEGYNVWNMDTLGGSQPGFLARQYTRIFGAATQPTMDPDPMVLVPNMGTQSSYFVGNTSYAFPFYTSGPLLRGASQALLVGYTNDFPRLSEVTLTHYGAPAKFLALGSAGSWGLPYGTGSSTTALLKTGFSPLLRWE